VRAKKKQNCVTVCKATPGKKASAHFGGDVKRSRGLRGAQVTLTFLEIYAWIRFFILMPFVRLGKSIWKVKGVTIGSPFGRIALGVNLAHEEHLYIRRWTLSPPAWAGGLSLERVFSLSVYVDDGYCSSYLICVDCLESIVKGMHGVEFSRQCEGNEVKFCDMVIHMTPSGLRLEPKLKHPPRWLGIQPSSERPVFPTARAPHWLPYSDTVLFGIFAGQQKRCQTITASRISLLRTMWQLSMCYILDGYTYKTLEKALGKLEWSDSKKDLLRLLRTAHKRGYFHAGKTIEEHFQAKQNAKTGGGH